MTDITLDESSKTPRTSSIVTEFTFIYTASVDVASSPPLNIAVVFLPHDNAPADLVFAALSDHLDRIPLAQEVWIVAHAPNADNLKHLTDQAAQMPRLDRPVVGMLIQPDGRWSSAQPSTTEGLQPTVDDDLVKSVQNAGLRQQFRDTRALLSAHGNFHFGKPGRTHTKHFLRAQPAVARDAHAHFVATGLLRLIDLRSIRRVWVDTAGITGVAAALGAIRAMHYPTSPLLLVDSFGGYDGLDQVGMRIAENDAALISCSTSGNLADKVSRITRITAERAITLSYLQANLVSTESTGAESAVTDALEAAAEPRARPVLCDLTQLKPVRDDSFIEPFDSYRANECVLCLDQGEPAVPLEGDGFLPVTGTLTARKILASDTPESLSGFVRIAVTRPSLRVRHRTRADRVRTIVTKLSPLFSPMGSEFEVKCRELIGAVEKKNRQFGPVDMIAYTKGDDSSGLAHAISSLLPDNPPVTDLDAAIEQLERRIERGESFPRHLQVVCAVASSGRTLLDASRRLRFVPESTGLSYVIAVAHPETEHGWNLVTSSLLKRSATTDNAVAVGWKIYRESSSGDDAWTRESKLLNDLITQDDGRIPTLSDHALSRLQIVEGLVDTEEPKQLFMASGVGPLGSRLPPLNQGFVFWDFDVDEPTEEQVFWTIASVMQTNRWSPATTRDGGRYMHVSGGGQFYVIEPAMFDRYNDPVIQASLLRAAGQGELDYSMDDARSRYCSDLIFDAASNSDRERGAAVNEFLLSLTLGVSYPQGRRDLRLTAVTTHHLLSRLAALPNLAPLTSGFVHHALQKLGSQRQGKSGSNPWG